MTPETLVELVRERAQTDGGAGLAFLPDGGEPARLTYADLDRCARVVAAELATRLAPGSRAILIYPPGLEFITAFFAALLARVVAVPVYPPGAAGLDAWIVHTERIIADAGAGAVLTTGELIALRDAMGLEIGGAGLQWIATDETDGDADDWRDPRVRPDDAAFIQYTSGSTALPKGVVLSHRNLMANQRSIAASFGLSRSSVVVSWLPMYHDMGLIGCVMHPLYVGAAAYLMSPLDFLQRPVRWLAAISRHGGTCGGGPNFCYELCLRRISEEERSGLDLSSWEVAFSGAEPVRARTIRRFTETFAGSGFAPSAWLPCYGLAEASLFVAGAPARHGARLLRVDRAELALGRAVPVPEHGTGAVEIVSSGVASPGDRVCIVGAGTARPVEPGGVGEIWVRGDGVASGYWNRDAETGETFGHRLEGETGSFLRTGDLGFVHAGELFVTGRSRELIIVRGRNVHPQDVEDAAQTADPRLRPGCGAAFALEAADEEVVVLVQETAVTDGQELERLLELVRERVLESQHVALAAVVLVGPRSVPKTSSGKLQRAACRQAFLAGEVALLAEWRSAAVPAPAAGAR